MRKKSRAFIVFMVLMIVSLVFIFISTYWHSLTGGDHVPFVFVFLLLPLALFLQVLFHEILHLIPSLLFGYDIQEISIGTGRRIFKGGVSGIRISIRLRMGGYVKTRSCKSALSEIIIILLPHLAEMGLLIYLFSFISEKNIIENGITFNPLIVSCWFTYTLSFFYRLIFFHSNSDFNHFLNSIRHFKWVNVYCINSCLFKKVDFYSKKNDHEKALEILSKLDKKYFSCIEVSIIEQDLLYHTGNRERLLELFYQYRFKEKDRKTYTNNFCWYSGMLYLDGGKGNLDNLIELSESTLVGKSEYMPLYYGTLATLHLMNKNFIKAKECFRHCSFTGEGELFNRFMEWMLYLKLEDSLIADRKRYPIFEIIRENQVELYPFWGRILQMADLLKIDLFKEFPEVLQYSPE